MTDAEISDKNQQSCRVEYRLRRNFFALKGNRASIWPTDQMLTRKQ